MQFGIRLLSLLLAQRVQRLYLLRVDCVVKVALGFKFEIVGVIKQSRPGFKSLVLEFTAYCVNRSLCIVAVLKEFLARRKFMDIIEKRLLVSYREPYRSVAISTISRWIKTVLSVAGIGTAIFKVLSTIAAVTSKTKAVHMPSQVIITISKAGWFNVGTFVKFDDKRVSQDRFQKVILRL